MAYLTLSLQEFDRDRVERLRDALGRPRAAEALGGVVWMYHGAKQAGKDRGTPDEIAVWARVVENFEDASRHPLSVKEWVDALVKCDYIVASDDGTFTIASLAYKARHSEAAKRSRERRKLASAIPSEPKQHALPDHLKEGLQAIDAMVDKEILETPTLGQVLDATTKSGTGKTIPIARYEEELPPRETGVDDVADTEDTEPEAWEANAQKEKFKHRRCEIELEHDGNPVPGHWTGVWTGYIYNPKRTAGHAFNTECPDILGARAFARMEAEKLNPPTPLRAPLPPAAPSAASGPTFSEGRRVSCSPAPESTPMEGERSVEGEGNGEKNGDAPTTSTARATNTRRRKTPVNQEVLSTIAPEDLAIRKPPRRAKPSAEERVAELRQRIPGSFVWTSYSNAYEKRYGVKPERNAKVSTQAALLVKRIGLELAEQVASFYVEHNDAYYVNRAHPIELLVTQYQKLVTEMRRGVTMTMTKAKRDEVHAETDAAIRNYIAKQEGTDVAKDISESPVDAG